MYLDNTTGENNRRSKLTEDQVREIRRIYDAGGRGQEFAKQFGIAWQTFNGIGLRYSWKHVKDE